jgi:hypothetical protein
MVRRKADTGTNFFVLLLDQPVKHCEIPREFELVYLRASKYLEMGWKTWPSACYVLKALEIPDLECMVVLEVRRNPLGEK